MNAVLARTEALRSVGGFDVAGDHFDDWAAWLSIADEGAVFWRIADPVTEWASIRSGFPDDFSTRVP